MNGLNYEYLSELVADKLADRLLATGVNDNLQDEQHLDMKGLQGLWGVGRTKAYELIKEHKVPVLKLDGKARIARKHAMRVIEDCTLVPPDAA